jgi:hypothetical protein
MSWTPAVPPPPVAGAPTGTGVGDGLGKGLGEPITTGDVAGVVTDVTGVVTGDVVVSAAVVLEPGPTAVTALPLGDAVAPPAAVQAVVAARTVRAPQPIAASLARPPDAR